MKIKIISENKYLDTLLLRKRDDVIVRQYDTGVIMGKYLNDKTYNVMYHPNLYRKSSLTEDYTNQLDYQPLSHPSIARNIFDDLFRHFFKSKDEYFHHQYEWMDMPNSELDVKCQNTIELTLEIDSSWVHKNNVFVVGKYFDQVKVEHQVGGIYKLTVGSENDTLYNLFNIAMLTVTFILVTNVNHPFYIEKGMVKRFIKILNNIENIPYFIVYLFKMRMMKSREFFAEVKKDLEDVLPMDCNFYYGNTHDMRIDFIKNLLVKDDTIDKSILDVGCGELRYLKSLGKYMNKGLFYNAVDLDESIALYVNILSKREQFNHLKLSFSTDVSGFVMNNPIILLSEVIEHNTEEEATEVIEEILESYKDFDTFVITTVNADFNKYYALSDKDNKRHEDHTFEFTKNQFIDFMTNILKDNYNYEFKNVGDEVNNESPTIACIIKNK
jgi:SAM-dependent methyltransferase